MRATLRKPTQSMKAVASCNSNYDNFKQEGTIAGLYDLGETIGKGHYAVVKLARHVFTGEKVAVKVIDKSRLDEISKSHLFQEVRCMKLVQHANVVKLYQVIDTQSKLYLILELGDGGDMYDYIMKHEKGLSEELARHYFSQIVNAIDFCHRLHVVHRDLKPENVVFFKNTDTVKLTDFGFSNKFVPGNKLDTSCGSLAYSAPEILLGDSYDAPAVDIWSLGVILFMLVCGQAPFQEANDSETLTMIMDCKYNIPNNISDQCKDLIKKMLVREPSDRAKLEDILAHPWLNPSGDVPLQEMEVPLVCQEELSVEDHNFVVEKMINGNFATVQEISESLSNHKYDHITATYYLLAERLLKKRRGSLSLPIPEAVEGAAVVTNAADTSKPVLSPLALSPRSSNPTCNLLRLAGSTTPSSATGGIGVTLEKSRTPFDCLVSPPSSHVSPANSTSFLNRLSSGHQGDDDDDDDDDVGSLNRSRDKLFHPPSFSNLSSASPSNLVGFSQLGLMNYLPPPPPSMMRPLFSVQSSPQLLNEICEEEGESEDEDNGDDINVGEGGNLIQRQQTHRSPSYGRNFSIASTSTTTTNTSYYNDNNDNSGQHGDNKKLENARKKRYADKKRAAINRNPGIRSANAFNVSSSEDVSDSEELKQQKQLDRKQHHHHYHHHHEQQQDKNSQQQPNKRQINRLHTTGCKVNDTTRKDNSEHSSDTDGPSGFLGRGRGLRDRYNHHHHNHQQQQPNNPNNNNNGSSKKQHHSENNDANDNISENLSEIDCDDYAEFQRSTLNSWGPRGEPQQINMLKAALIKLNIACGDDNDDEYDGYDCDNDDRLSGLSSSNRSRRNSKKLFSVLEENLPHHHYQQSDHHHHPLSSLSSSSVSSALKLSSTSPVLMATQMICARRNDRKASSMMNISQAYHYNNHNNINNNNDDSLSFLDLHKEDKYSTFDDKSKNRYYDSFINNIKATLYRSMDCNLNDESGYSDYYCNYNNNDDNVTNIYGECSSKLAWQNSVLRKGGYQDISLLA